MADHNASNPAFKAGLFIVLATAAAAVLIAVVSGGLSALQSTQSYTIRFTRGADLSGLTRGADVRVLGVTVGSVDEMQVRDVDGQGAVVEVEVSVPERFTLRAGAEASASAALTGGAWINITSLGEGAAVEPGGTIEGQTRTLGGVLAEAQSLLPQAKTTLSQFADAAASVQRLADEAEATVQDARAVLDGTQEDIKAALASARGVSEELDRRLPEVSDASQRVLKNLDDAISRAYASLDELPGILGDTDRTIQQIEAVAGAAQGLIGRNGTRIDQLVGDLGSAARSADGAIDEIRAAPWRLLYKPDEDDQANLAVYSLARRYAEAARDLELAAGSLAQASGGGSAGDLAELQTEVEAAFGRFESVQATLWERLRIGK